MAKLVAVVRSMFLVFIIVYTLVMATPTAIWDSATATVTVEAMRRLQRATWIAIAWIAFETLLSWIVLAFRQPRHRHPAAGADQGRPGSPPSTPSAAPRV